MSTKIYNGYRIIAESLDEVISKLNLLKVEAKTVALSSILKEEIFSAVKMYDSVVYKNVFYNKGITENLTQTNNDKAFKINLDHSCLVNSYRRNLDSFWNKDKNDREEKQEIEINIVLYPEAIDIDGQKNYLLSLYAERELEDWIIKKWKKLGIKEYGYWNNTDRPNKVTIKQWEKREQDWNKVLIGKGKSGIPEVEGISIILTRLDKYFYNFDHETTNELRKKLMLGYSSILSLDSRIKEYMLEFKTSIVMDRLRQKEENIEEKSSNFDVSEIMQNYFNARDIIRNDECLAEEKMRFEVAQKALTEKLKADIILSDLQEPLIKVEEYFLNNNLKNIYKMKIK